MATIEEYQRFVSGSSMHRGKIDEILKPIDDFLELEEDRPSEVRKAQDALVKVRGLLQIAYAALGLAGEAGEFADKVKKLIRDGGGDISPERLDGLKKELGDVEWYATDAATVLGLSKQETIDGNIAKLEDRKARGVRQGDGDNR